MENEYTNKPCYYCINYERYYTLGNKRFNKAKCGRCREHNKITQMHDTCDEYKRKPYTRKPKYTLHLALNRLLAEITQIREVLENDCYDE